MEEGKVKVKLSGISSDIFIEATVKTKSDICISNNKKFSYKYCKNNFKRRNNF